MDASRLQQAATQAKTAWLEQALTDLLPQVWDLTTTSPRWQETATSWATQFNRLFQEKKLTTPAQQKNRRTDIANALRTIAPNHPAIPFVLLPTAVYTQLNNDQANRLNARTNKCFSIQQADELVERAITLLASPAPEDLAAGLAVLVGRRISEILLADFKPKTPYSLLFTAAVKRRGQAGMEFEIPTLATTAQVLGAINHLKQVWNIEDLKALDLPENHLKRRINARYARVPHACRQHFADLVPGREAATDTGERLYTHLFRAVYAEIATYYYKPDWVPDHRFKAEIQGHFKLTQDGQKIPNYSARQNYDDYLIRERAPGQPGVKLALPGVVVLEVFQQEKPMDDQSVDDQSVDDKIMGSQTLETGTMNALIYRAVERLLFANQWADALTGLVLVTGRSIQSLQQTRLREKAGFSIWVDGLEVPTLTGASQVVAAWKQWQQLEPLPREQVELAIQEVCDRTFGDLVCLQSVHALQAVYSAITIHWFCPINVAPEVFLHAIGATETTGFVTPKGEQGIKLGQHNVQTLEQLQAVTPMPDAPIAAITPEPKPKPKPRHRRKTLSVDPDRLRIAAAAFGIQIRGRAGTNGLGYEAALAQLLEYLAQGQSPPTPPQPTADEGAITAIKDQAKTLAWLTGRMEVLEQQVEKLQQERDEAIAQVNQAGDSAQVEHLQQENQRLRHERDEASSKLQAFRQLLLGTGMQQEQKAENQPKQRMEPTFPPAATQPAIEVPEPPQSPRKRIPEEDALGHIRRAVQAIMALNDQDERAFDAKWYISFPVVQTLLRVNGLSANQKNVSTVFEEMKQELEHHHDKHQLGSRHNRRHPHVEKIAQLISLDQ